MPPSSIPPALPPSVEEAYRRKCLQLKRRTNEVEEDNEAARLRLIRLRRGVEKLRLERAFLLEQLSKRTSANVEDSEGSPSPPPTPQDKPLRSKRGHRKPSVVATLEPSNGPPPTFINQSVHNLSPSSDAFSHSVHAEASTSQSQLKETPAPRSNGVSGNASSSKAEKKPNSAFDLYCNDNREAAKESKAEGVTVEEELARGWKELSDSKKEEYMTKEKAETEEKEEKEDKEDKEEKKKEEEKEAKEEKETETERRAESQADDTPAHDEDVDMDNDD